MEFTKETDRVIALIDMDCFYAQVEQNERPDSIGKPLAAVQYSFHRGMILSSNYEARALGVKGYMTVDEALSKCPDLIVATVPSQRNKADLSKFRNASQKVFNVIIEFATSAHEITVEVASIDEAYLDLTLAVKRILDANMDWDNLATLEDLPTTRIVAKGDQPVDLGDWLIRIHERRRMCDLKLAIGAKLVEQIRERILKEAGYHCSAGIGENKMLAKLVCKLHKPKHQTIITRATVTSLFERTPISDVRNLGGKLGAEVCAKFKIETMAQLSAVPLESLKQAFKDKVGTWLHDLSHGIDTEEVTTRQLPKSIGCSKNFMGKMALKTRTDVQKWLTTLAEELEERLRKDQASHHRTARNLCISLRLESSTGQITRHCPLVSYDNEKIIKDAVRVISEFNDVGQNAEQWKPAIINLSISAGRFEDCVDILVPITDYFKPTKSGSSPAASVVSKRRSSRSVSPGISVIPKPKSTDFVVVDDDAPGPSNSNCANAIPEPDEQQPKNSFFVKRLPNLRPDQKAEEKSNSKRDDHGKRSRLQKRITTALIVPQKKPRSESIDPLIKGDHFVHVDGWLPDGRQQVNEEIWRDLPPEIRWELNQHFKRCGNGDEEERSISSSGSSKARKSSKGAKKSSAKSTNGHGIRTLPDYFEPLQK